MSVHRYDLLTFALYCFNADYLFSHIKRTTTEQTNKQMDTDLATVISKAGTRQDRLSFNMPMTKSTGLLVVCVIGLSIACVGLLVALTVRSDVTGQYLLCIITIKVYRWKNIMSIIEGFMTLTQKTLNFQFLPNNRNAHITLRCQMNKQGEKVQIGW